MADRQEKRIVDLSHVIEHGMTTYPGLPGPQICDFWEREGTAANYEDGSTFQMGRIDMVANTGTYLDSPFHRYADGKDLADLPLESIADLRGVVVRQPWDSDIAVDLAAFDRPGCRGEGRAGSHRLGSSLANRSLRQGPFFPDQGSGRMAGRPWRGPGRDRQQQYRRHEGSNPACAYEAAGYWNCDLRAYDRARPASGRRLPILGSAARRFAAWGLFRFVLTRCWNERVRPSAIRAGSRRQEQHRHGRERLQDRARDSQPWSAHCDLAERRKADG